MRRIFDIRDPLSCIMLASAAAPRAGDMDQVRGSERTRFLFAMFSLQASWVFGAWRAQMQVCAVAAASASFRNLQLRLGLGRGAGREERVWTRGWGCAWLSFR